MDKSAAQCGAAAQLEPNSILGGHSAGIGGCSRPAWWQHCSSRHWHCYLCTVSCALCSTVHCALLAVVSGSPTADKYPTLRTYVPLSVCLTGTAHTNQCSHDHALSVHQNTDPPLKGLLLTNWNLKSRLKSTRLTNTLMVRSEYSVSDIHSVSH